jgi:hypothetical protein
MVGATIEILKAAAPVAQAAATTAQAVATVKKVDFWYKMANVVKSVFSPVKPGDTPTDF